MRNALEVGRAFVLMFFRDRLNVFFTLCFNAFLMILLGITVEDRFNITVPVGLFDESHAGTAASVIARLEREPTVRVTRLASEAEVRRQVHDGKIVAGMLLAPGTDGASVHARLLTDPSRRVWARVLAPVLTVAMLESETATAIQARRHAVVVEEVRARHLSYFDFLFPGVLAFTVMQVAFSGALSLLNHRKSAVLTRLKITPLARWEFLGGYAASQVVLLLLQIAAYWLLAAVAFGYDLSGSIAQTAFIVALGSTEFVCLGVLIANLAPSIEVGNNLVRALSFPAAFLCGVFVPLDTLPKHLATAASVYPLTGFVSALRATTNNGASLSAVAAPVVVMCLVLIVSAALAVRSFHWEEQSA